MNKNKSFSHSMSADGVEITLIATLKPSISSSFAPLGGLDDEESQVVCSDTCASTAKLLSGLTAQALDEVCAHALQSRAVITSRRTSSLNSPDS